MKRFRISADGGMSWTTQWLTAAEATAEKVGGHIVEPYEREEELLSKFEKCRHPKKSTKPLISILTQEVGKLR